MNDGPVVRIDRSAVRAQVEKVRTKLDSPFRWLAASWVRGFVLCLVALFVAGLLGTGLVSLSPWAGPTVALAAAFAVLVATVFTWMEWRMVPRSDAAFVRKVEKEWQQMTGRGWLRRVVAMAVLMGVGIGTPVGFLLAYSAPGAEPSGASMFLSVLAFVGLTLLWTLPASFGIRWMSIRQFRKYVIREPGPEDGRMVTR